MGAMPFSELFRSRKPAPDGSTGVVRAGRSEDGSVDRAAIVTDLERSGVSWFWATDAGGRVTYLSDTIAKACGASFDSGGTTALQTLLTPVSGEGEGRSLGLKLGARKAFSNLLVETTGGDPAGRLILRLSGRVDRKSVV